VTAARFLVDTSALARLMREGAESFGWDQAATAGLLALCPVTELEFFYSARSLADREKTIQDLHALFGWVAVHDRAYARAWEVQGELTARGEHSGAGTVDLIVAATAELHDLTLLHHDHDFELIAAITGQALRWYGTN
jgi:predicted nucleic acid-binding protein